MWAWVLTWCPLSSLFRELVVNCEHVPSSFELTFYFFIIKTVHFQKIIPNRRGNLYNLVLTFVVFHFVRHLGNWASVSAAWDIWGMHKWQVQSNSQSQHKMAKVGDLSDNEKLLFSRLNKGNDMGFVGNKIFLGTFFLFRLGFFYLFEGNDQEAMKLLSSGDVRINCLDEVLINWSFFMCGGYVLFCHGSIWVSTCNKCIERSILS